MQPSVGVEGQRPSRFLTYILIRSVITWNGRMWKTMPSQGSPASSRGLQRRTLRTGRSEDRVNTVSA